MSNLYPYVFTDTSILSSQFYEILNEKHKVFERSDATIIAENSPKFYFILDFYGQEIGPIDPDNAQFQYMEWRLPIANTPQNTEIIKALLQLCTVCSDCQIAPPTGIPFIPPKPECPGWLKVYVLNNNDGEAALPSDSIDE